MLRFQEHSTFLYCCEWHITWRYARKAMLSVNCKNCYANTPHIYIIRTLPLLLIQEIIKKYLRSSKRQRKYYCQNFWKQGIISRVPVFNFSDLGDPLVMNYFSLAFWDIYWIREAVQGPLYQISQAFRMALFFCVINTCVLWKSSNNSLVDYLIHFCD